MRGFPLRKRMPAARLLCILTCVLTASVASAAQIVSTTARGVASVANLGGFGIAPAGTQPARLADDLAPVQLFEITKPAGQSVTIGRMFTSCTCVILESDQRTFGPGEKAMLRMRNVQATPPGGQSYALYVQITAPIAVTLRYDTYVQSSQFVPAADGAPPTRGNIVADGVWSPGMTADAATVVDVYVPKAENYVPDTSEYTLRRKAEEEKESAATKAATAKAASAAREKAGTTTALKTKTTGPAVTAVPGPSTLAAKPPEQPKKETPTIPAELRNTIDAAITQAEKNLVVNPGVADFSAEGLAGGTAGPEARLSPDLKTDQSASYQTEARQIAQDILYPSQTSASARSTQSAQKTDDEDLWRTPKPRGRVRSTASLSGASSRVASTATGAPAAPQRSRTAAPSASSSAAGMRVGRSTPGEAAIQKLETQGQSVIDSLAAGSTSTSTSTPTSTSTGAVNRSLTDTLRSAESSVAERAREAALEAGRNVTNSIQSPGVNPGAVESAVNHAGQALEALRTANRP